MKKHIFLSVVFLIVAGIAVFGGNDAGKKQNYIIGFYNLENLFDTYNDPVCYWLIQDSLVMVQNQPQSDYMIEIFSLNTQKRILALATRGNGPGEFRSCKCIVPSSQSPVFYIKDAQQSKMYTVNIPQTLQTGELAIEKQFQYSEDIHPQTDICILNDTEYAGYHFWHLDDSTYNNGIPAIQKYKISD